MRSNEEVSTCNLWGCLLFCLSPSSHSFSSLFAVIPLNILSGHLSWARKITICVPSSLAFLCAQLQISKALWKPTPTPAWRWLFPTCGSKEQRQHEVGGQVVSLIIPIERTPQILICKQRIYASSSCSLWFLFCVLYAISRSSNCCSNSSLANLNWLLNLIEIERPGHGVPPFIRNKSTHDWLNL